MGAFLPGSLAGPNCIGCIGCSHLGQGVGQTQTPPQTSPLLSHVSCARTQALALQAHAEALETRVAQLEGDLHGTRQQLAAAEDRLAKAARAPGGGASPLREVVGGLRLELQEKDLQLMQVCRGEMGWAETLGGAFITAAAQLSTCEAATSASSCCLSGSA